MSQTAISDFLASRQLALAGASRKQGKFGNIALKTLSEKGFTVFPIHPEAEQIQGHRCVHSLQLLPPDVKTLVTIVPPPETEKLVEEAIQAKFKAVWMQPGSESPAAIQRCHEAGLTSISGTCILMHAEPRGLHKVHAWLNRIFRKSA